MLWGNPGSSFPKKQQQQQMPNQMFHPAISSNFQPSQVQNMGFPGVPQKKNSIGSIFNKRMNENKNSAHFQMKPNMNFSENILNLSGGGQQNQNDSFTKQEENLHRFNLKEFYWLFFII